MNLVIKIHISVKYVKIYYFNLLNVFNVKRCFVKIVLNLGLLHGLIVLVAAKIL